MKNKGSVATFYSLYLNDHDKLNLMLQGVPDGIWRFFQSMLYLREDMDGMTADIQVGMLYETRQRNGIFSWARGGRPD